MFMPFLLDLTLFIRQNKKIQMNIKHEKTMAVNIIKLKRGILKLYVVITTGVSNRST